MGGKKKGFTRPRKRRGTAEKLIGGQGKVKNRPCSLRLGKKRMCTLRQRADRLGANYGRVRDPRAAKTLATGTPRFKPLNLRDQEGASTKAKVPDGNTRTSKEDTTEENKEKSISQNICACIGDSLRA